jgi:NAD+ synthase (glutamine-hydrolysing)
MTTRAPFFSPYAHDFVRLAVGVPRLRPADPVYNTDAMLELLGKAHDRGSAIMLFPELGVSAYAIDDLLLQSTLLEAVQAQITLGRS